MTGASRISVVDVNLTGLRRAMEGGEPDGKPSSPPSSSPFASMSSTVALWLHLDRYRDLCFYNADWALEWPMLSGPVSSAPREDARRSSLRNLSDAYPVFRSCTPDGALHAARRWS